MIQRLALLALEWSAAAVAAAAALSAVASGSAADAVLCGLSALAAGSTRSLAIGRAVERRLDAVTAALRRPSNDAGGLS